MRNISKTNNENLDSCIIYCITGQQTLKAKTQELTQLCQDSPLVRLVLVGSFAGSFNKHVRNLTVCVLTIEFLIKNKGIELSLIPRVFWTPSLFKHGVAEIILVWVVLILWLAPWGSEVRDMAHLSPNINKGLASPSFTFVAWSYVRVFFSSGFNQRVCWLDVIFNWT